ncbi:MAG: transporter [Rhodovibrionaceae bacterium]
MLAWAWEAAPAAAETDQAVLERLKALEETVAAQQEQLNQQEGIIARQQQQLNFNDGELHRMKSAMIQYMVPGGTGTVTTAGTGLLDSLRGTGTGGTVQAAQSGTEPGTVGEQPEQQRPEVAALSDTGGILTPPGTVILEPSLQFSTSETDRFFFRGVEIIDTVLIGAIDARQVRRETAEAAVTARVGITDWLEAAVKVPYVYRSDDFRGLTLGGAEFGDESVTGSGLGDIELFANAQLSDGPIYVIANTRIKTDTGKGPFDVDRDSNGVETELATGSGFWAVEPSVTFIAPSDPVVFFANLGYSFNLGRDVKADLDSDTRVTHVDPGDVAKATVGVGIALNQNASLSFSYEHNYIFPTHTDLVVDDEKISAKSDHAHVGLLGIAATYRFNETFSITGQVQVGATEEAPDMRAVIRVPITLNGLLK